MSRVTLKQVAFRAGVSYQTVSKVINRKATVSKETEDRIWETIRSLGYRPNLIARGLRSRRSLLIGYSWEPSSLDHANPILDQFLQSMAKAAESAGYHLLAFPHHTGKQWIDAYRELIDTNRVDGFVLSSVEYDDPRIQFLHERKFPFVAFGRSNPGWEFPFVDIDGAAGMRMVVEHLVSQGHRRIAALAWPEASRVGQNRMEGFLKALLESGISPPPGWISRGEGIYTFGRQATRQLLDQDASNRPTAIVAFNDIMAIGAMHAATDKGVKVGHDIAITGFDDFPMVQYLTPGLTSVRQPIWEAGECTISLLLDLFNNRPVKDRGLLLEPSLVVRESSSRAG